MGLTKIFTLPKPCTNTIILGRFCTCLIVLNMYTNPAAFVQLHINLCTLFSGQLVQLCGFFFPAAMLFIQRCVHILLEPMWKIVQTKYKHCHLCRNITVEGRDVCGNPTFISVYCIASCACVHFLISSDMVYIVLCREVFLQHLWILSIVRWCDVNSDGTNLCRDVSQDCVFFPCKIYMVVKWHGMVLCFSVNSSYY